QAYFFVADDMMDSSITRSGQHCWYPLPKVNMVAISNALMLEAAISHRLLKTYLFHQVTYQIEMGQLVGLITNPEDSVDLDKFSLERYRLIAYTAPSPSLPSQSKTVHAYALAQSITIPLGEYFQIQDDWLDFSGTPEQIGKIGTYIVDNKCSWKRIVQDENYGRKDKNEEKVQQVAYEEKVVGELKERIDKILEVEGSSRRRLSAF
ncbi:isoprenoid synthase domain-containing protein, partial [Crucibulum laeve]